MVWKVRVHKLHAFNMESTQWECNFIWIWCIGPLAIDILHPLTLSAAWCEA